MSKYKVDDTFLFKRTNKTPIHGKVLKVYFVTRSTGPKEKYEIQFYQDNTFTATRGMRCSYLADDIDADSTFCAVAGKKFPPGLTMTHKPFQIDDLIIVRKTVGTNATAKVVQVLHDQNNPTIVTRYEIEKTNGSSKGQRVMRDFHICHARWELDIAALHRGQAAIIWPINSQIVTKGHPFHKAQIIDYQRNALTGEIVGYDILRNTGARESHTVATLHSFWDLMVTQSQVQAGAQMLTYGRFGGSFKEEAAEEWKVTEVFTITRKSICDCGGHKLGYKDDELHGHATWCKLVENAAATILITHGEK